MIPHHSPQPTSSQVPGQFLGYGLQYTRMVLLLLESHNDAIVSLELFEDVGVQTGDKLLAAQAKSSVSNNPVSNRAEPFWKTLSNWLKAIEVGQLPTANTLFELYVFGDFEGEICTLFSNAGCESDAQAAVSEAVKILAAGRKEPLPLHVKAVLDADRSKLCSLIARFRYRHGSGVSGASLLTRATTTNLPDRRPHRAWNLVRACLTYQGVPFSRPYPHTPAFLDTPKRQPVD